MSKIAEKKALEKYPELDGYIGNIPLKEAYNYARNGYSDGYDQAMQDFLEYLKYCSTFTYSNGYKRIDDDLYNKLVEDFKNYIQNEEM